MPRGKQNNRQTNEMKPRQVQAFESRAKASNPVATEGTTEVSPSAITQPNDSIQQRYEAYERQKEKDIAQLLKESDGKPKV